MIGKYLFVPFLKMGSLNSSAAITVLPHPVGPTSKMLVGVVNLLTEILLLFPNPFYSSAIVVVFVVTSAFPHEMKLHRSKQP